MRFSIFYKLSKDTIPIDYRRGIISLLKKAFENSNIEIYKNFYENKNNITKPFTFSVYLPYSNIKENEIVTSRKLILNFSTNSILISTYLYNGLLKLKEYPLFNNTLLLEHFIYEPEIKIKSNVCLFRTMSPILIESREPDKYLVVGDIEFEKEFNYHLNTLFKNFLPNKMENVISFIPKNIKKIVITHFGLKLDGMIGEFFLKGDSECLQLIYDIGLGARRNQGFGMLKLITQIKSKENEDNIR